MKQQFQFSLRILLLFVVVVAVLMSIYGSLKLFVFEPDNQRLCESRLRRIGNRIDNYFFNIVPPALLCDSNGKPIHSWRCLFDAVNEWGEGHRCPYDFTKPWDSPINRTPRNEEEGRLFQCPSSGNSSRSTNFVAVIGPDTMWPGRNGIRIPEGIESETILVIEVPASDIHWMEPRDVTLEELWNLIRSPSGNGIRSLHRQGLAYLAIDKTIRYLPPETDFQKLSRLVQRDSRCEVVSCNHQEYIQWFLQRWNAPNPQSFSPQSSLTPGDEQSSSRKLHE